MNKFSGYVAIFNQRDQLGDIILPTAFDDWLSLGKGCDVRNNHITLMGYILEFAVDTKGLFVRAVCDYDPGFRGLSFGYHTVRGQKICTRINGVFTQKRVLHQINLHEVSICKKPAQPLACITSWI